MLREALKEGIPDRTVAYAALRALVSRHRLPPGTLDPPLDRQERADRLFLQQRFDTLGPLFKGRAWGQFWIYLRGIARCRRLLLQHGADLAPVTLDLSSVLPKGFMRQMQGEDHRRYRTALVRAVREEDQRQAQGELDRLASQVLDRYARAPASERESPEAFREALTDCASGMLVRLFFGAEPGSSAHRRLLAGFHRLGPRGLVWNLQARQKAAFAELATELRTQLSTLAPDSVAGRLKNDAALDDTLLGNLVYMVEMGRHDLQGFLRWLSWFCAHHPGWQERLADESSSPDASGPRPLAQAFAYETLRLEQSERLVRQARRDFSFEGYLIPRYARLRLCMWEAHKAAEAFPEPMRFDPTRFLHLPPSPDCFSPFGLDRHQCPLAGMSIRLGVQFLGSLTRRWRLRVVADGAAVRGTYHWEPAREFAVELLPR